MSGTRPAVGTSKTLPAVSERLLPAVPLSARPAAAAAAADGPPVRGYVLAGGVALLLVFGGFGGWAALAPLSSAAIAPGSVKVDTNRKTVQHLEGGIIRELLVRDGDTVRRGQALVRLDGLDAEADRNAAQARLDSLAASEARLAAERDGRDSVAFPAELLARRADPAIAEILAGQEHMFGDQKRALADQLDVWVRRVEQYKAQISSLEAQNAATEAQLPLFQEELQAQEYLMARGLALKPKLLALERQIAAAKGEIAANQGRIASLREQIAEANVQMNGIRSTRAKTVSEELREVQTNRGEIEEQLRKLIAKTGRSELVAPEDGVVMNMQYFTLGGVIAPGAAVLDLVPQQEKLVFEVRVRPLDIDVVRTGLPATIRLTAYKQRLTPTLQGRVTQVSADAISDERAKTSYYAATVEIDSLELARVPHVQLYPGMPVDVAIMIGERTLLGYLIQPLTDGFARAFREQ